MVAILLFARAKSIILKLFQFGKQCFFSKCPKIRNLQNCLQKLPNELSSLKKINIPNKKILTPRPQRRQELGGSKKRHLNNL